MKIFIAISAVFIFFISPCYSQDNNQTKIDSLFSVLSLAKDHPTKVDILNAISFEFRYANTDTSTFFANQAFSLARKLGYQMGMADAEQRIGMLCATLGRYDEGVKACENALVIYQKLLLSAIDPEKTIILKKMGSTYNVIGHNRISQGNYPEGLKNSFLALKIREQIGIKSGIADTQYNIANIYLHENNYSEALKYYRMSLKISEELGDKVDIAGTYNTIGFVYFSQGNYPEALKNYTTALNILSESGDKYTLAELYNNLGVLKEKQGNYSEALTHNFDALRIYEEIGINEQLPFVYNNIASIYIRQNKHKDAFEYLNKALITSKKMGGLEYIKLTYQNFAVLDSARGDFKNSLEKYKLAILYRDSLVNKDNTKKTVQLQMQYDFDKKESETKALQEKKDVIAQKEMMRQKMVRNGFIGGFGVMLLFAGVFFTQRNKIKAGKKRSDELLLNILPGEVAEELKAKGNADAKQFDEVTVMFTDFKGFTQISEKLSPGELVAEIHTCFKAFDNIITNHNIEKIKTIGDSYMCAGGLPVSNKTNATDVVSAALEIQQFMQEHLQKRKSENKEPFEIRIGVHTGPVVAGIVGVKKFAYDIWGDTVNIASRMESSGEPGKVNISGNTYDLIKNKFSCTHRGKIQAKNKGEVDMYFVESKSMV